MKNRISAAAILLILPSVLSAQSGRRSYHSSSRSTFRGSSAAVHRTTAAPRTIQSFVTHIVAAANSNPVLTAHPATVSPAARANAIQALTANGWKALSSAPAAQSGRGRSRGYNNGSFRTRTYEARRADDPQTPAPQTPAPQTESIPPYLYTPGALIRTEGLGYTATPTNDAHWANNDQGYAIVQDPNQATLLNPFAGVHMGPADKLPPPNAGSGGTASGRNAITPNAAPSEGY